MKREKGIGNVRRITSLCNELDELRTEFLIKDKNEHFSKGVSAGIIISLNYIADYFPEAYGRWSLNHLNKKMKEFILKKRGKIIRKAAEDVRN